MFDIDVAVYHADGYLGSKFGVCFGFASYYGSHIGLTDADDAVFDLVDLFGLHLSLLAVKFANSRQFPGLPGAQFAMSLKIEKWIYCLQVPA
jgi:hypothetical protein